MVLLSLPNHITALPQCLLSPPPPSPTAPPLPPPPPTHTQVPPARISSMDPQQLRHSLHKEVQTLLGPEGRVRVLLIGLSQPAEPSGRLQVWLLSSVLEAADLVLWVDVSTPGTIVSVRR